MGRVNVNSRYRINLDEAERKMLRWAIKSLVKIVGDGGYQDATAEFLGITPTYLRSRIKTVKIDVAEVLALAGATESAKRAEKRREIKRNDEPEEVEDDEDSEDSEDGDEDSEDSEDGDDGSEWE